MKLNIYLGNVITTPISVGMDFYFSSSPSIFGTDSISFDYYTNYPLTGATTTITVPLLAIPSPYTNEQMASDFRSFASLNSSLTAVYDSGNTFASIRMNNGSPIFNVIYSNSFGYSSEIVELKDDTSYEIIDLFDDETIELTSKLSDIEKLSNVFIDLTNSFTIPATPHNNKIFKHYYDIDIDNTFNANIRVYGYIEIDSLPLRFGKIQLEQVTLKKNLPDNYKITFYGGVIQLTDLFGDDLLSELDYEKDLFGNLTKKWNSLSKYDFPFNESSFINMLTNPSFNDGLIMPLINYGTTEWNYGTGINNTLSSDISTVGGAINSRTLRPALKIFAIIEAIEIKYGIKFSRSFFSEANFQNLFMWLNGDSEKQRFKLDFTSNFIEVAGNVPDPRGYRTSVNLDSNIIKLETYDVSGNPKGKSDNIILNLSWPFAGVGNNLDAVDGTDINMTIYYIDRRPNSDGKVLFTETKTFSPSDSHFFQNTISASALGITVGNPLFFEVIIETNKAVVWNNFRFNVLYSYLPPFNIFLYEDRSNNSNGLDNNYMVSATMPKIKVIDWLQGIMKQFKLIVRPISQSIFDIIPIDYYYSKGNILDITNYVDQSQVIYERPLIYKDIKFNYEKTNNVLGKKFREINDPINDLVGYGDLKATYSSIDSKESLDIKLPFENMLFERLINNTTTTNIYIGESINLSDSGSISQNKSKPILFYNNGINDFNGLSVKVKFKSYANTSGITSSYLIGNTNDWLIDQVTNTINWGSENDPWHMLRVDNSLYLNYWSNWINTIYDLKQRKLSFDAILPPRYVQELSLNDRLIIGNNRYKINDYKIDLTNGKTKLNLFKDIYESQYIPQNFITGYIGGSGKYLVDYYQDGENAYLYGSFDTYNGISHNSILKIKKNGLPDDIFSTGAGLNTPPYDYSDIISIGDDLYVSGVFTQYNGQNNQRLIKINKTTGNQVLSFANGFNNFTTPIVKDSLSDSIFVGGIYSTYSGVTNNRLVKLKSNGLIDSSFNTGSGFANTVVDLLSTPDGGVIATTYSTTYNGTSIPRLVKILSGGTIDTSFNIGAGLNSTGFQADGLVKGDGEKAYIYGAFTQYSGITKNRITKINMDGSIDPNFIVYSGFNGTVEYGKELSNGKVLLASTFNYGGNYTKFDGISCNSVILNPNGTIFRTFPEDYFIYNIGDIYYGVDISNNGQIYLLSDETYPALSTNEIICNAGSKYYGINLVNNSNWSTSKVDYGFGIDWVDITNPSGFGSTELVIKIKEKASQLPPEIYQPRWLDIIISYDNNVYRSFRVIQNGLAQ